MTYADNAPFALIECAADYPGHLNRFAVLNTNSMEVEARILPDVVGKFGIWTDNMHGGWNRPTASERGFATPQDAFAQWCADYVTDCATP